MTTPNRNEQIFARLFRMMDSPFEAEALSAFRHVRRVLQEESATFGSILDHTQQLKDTNTALGQQNQELHRENLKFRERYDRFALARAAVTRVREFSARFVPDAAAAGQPNIAAFRAGTGIPRDVGSLLAIFALIATTVVSCELFASGNPNPPHGGAVAASAQMASWSTDAQVDGRAAATHPPARRAVWAPSKLPTDFSIDHPPWCPACRPQAHRSEEAGWPTRLPADFSIDHPPWCRACRGQQAHPHADRRRSYERVF